MVWSALFSCHYGGFSDEQFLVQVFNNYLYNSWLSVAIAKANIPVTATAHTWELQFWLGLVNIVEHHCNTLSSIIKAMYIYCILVTVSLRFCRRTMVVNWPNHYLCEELQYIKDCKLWFCIWKQTSITNKFTMLFKIKLIHFKENKCTLLSAMNK